MKYFRYKFNKTRLQMTSPCLICEGRMNKGSKIINIIKDKTIIGQAHYWHKNDTEALHNDKYNGGRITR